MKKLFGILLATAALASIAATAQAGFTAVMTDSTSAPTVGPSDIADLSTNGSFDNNANTAIWSDKPGQGQSFTTLSNPGGYELDSVTLGINGAGGSHLGAANTLTINIGTYTSNTFTVLDSYTAQGIYVNENQAQFATWTLNTPLALNPNTVYGFEVGTDGAGLIVQTSLGNYTGGTAFSTGPAGGETVTSTTPQDFGRHFQVSLSDLTPVPEPSNWVMAMMLGGAGVIVAGKQIRRNRKS